MQIGRVLAAACVLSVSLTTSAFAGIRAGRDLPAERDAGLRITAGAIVSIRGSVEETSRLFYTVTGQQASQLTREDYDIEDFGMDGGYATLGLSTETAWKFFTLQSDFMLLDMDTESTAIRNYYIGVDSVSFGGVDYDYMQIPAGRPFTANLTGAILEMRGLITPFTFHSADSFRATPWLSLGLFVMGGSYEINAGTATGLIQYQNPPETFVVGGTADGSVGAGLPEIGVGGELRFGRDDAAHLVIQGNFAVCRYNGSTDWLTSASHREKDIDLNHMNIKAAASLEIPFESGRALSAGIHLQLIDTEATVTSQGGTVQEIIAARERFDKEVDFRMLSAGGSLGLRF